MFTVTDLFAAFGGPAEVARALSVKPSTASEMKRRRSVPVAHWPALVRAAADRGVDGVSYDVLVAMHVAPGARKSSGEQATAA